MVDKSVKGFILLRKKTPNFAVAFFLGGKMHDRTSFERHMKNRILLFSTLLMLISNHCNAQLNINIRYTGAEGAARKYVKEMEESGIAARIRAVEGCIRYDYFFPADDPEGLLLIDEWADQAALDRYHASPMMTEAAALREKYGLGGRQIRMFNPLAPAAPRVTPGNRPATDLHCHMIPDSYLRALKAHGMEMDEGFPIPAGAPTGSFSSWMRPVSGPLYSRYRPHSLGLKMRKSRRGSAGTSTKGLRP